MKKYERYNERRANIDNLQVEPIYEEQKNMIFMRVRDRIMKRITQWHKVSHKKVR